MKDQLKASGQVFDHNKLNWTSVSAALRARDQIAANDPYLMSPLLERMKRRPSPAVQNCSMWLRR